MQGKTDLSTFDNSWYNPGSRIKRLLWYFCNITFLKSYWLPVGALKVALLRVFGAKIGKGVVIKPGVNIKYPWLLSIGDHTWIGEGVWIDNLAQVNIGAHCCLSQDAFLLCGNHDYKKASFDLIAKEITLEDGSWVGAKSVMTPGSTLKSHAVLAVQSVGIGTLDAYTIYQGNPAVAVRKRALEI